MRKSLKRQIAVLTIGTAFLLAGCSGGSQTAGNQAADTQAAQAADDAASGAGGEQSADGAVDYGSLELTMGSTGAADDISTQAMTYMKDYIEERAVEIANYIIENNATVRQTAKRFGISKSTVHKDVTDRLEHINPSLAAQWE